MLIKKTLETTLDLFQHDDIYCLDVEAMLIKKLTEKYANRCFKSMLILKILKILKKSSIHFEDNRLDGGAHIDVTFEAEGEVYTRGEVIHGCRIIEIQGNIIAAENKYAGIKLIHNDQNTIPILKVLEVDHVIPIVVQRVAYNMYKSKISISGTPYIPIFTPVIWFDIQEGLTPDQTEKITKYLEIIATEEEEHKKISKEKRYELFKNIMYPFKTLQQIDKRKDFTILSMKPISIDTDPKKFLSSVLDIESGIITYPCEDHRLNHRFFYSNKKLSEENTKSSIKATMFQVLSDILVNYSLYLRCLRGFVETYKDLDDAKKLASYLSICKSKQIA